MQNKQNFIGNNRSIKTPYESPKNFYRNTSVYYNFFVETQLKVRHNKDSAP